MSKLYSMTGYAAARLPTEAGDLAASLRAVNGRNLDLHFHLGSDFCRFEPALRRLLKAQIRRGHVEVRLSLLPSSSGARSAYNRDLLASYIASFRAANEEFGLRSEPDLNTFLSLPGVFEVAQSSGLTPSEAEVASVFEECLKLLNEFREREGAELGTAIRRDLADMARNIADISAIRASIGSTLQHRLQERLADLLGQSTISPARLVEEAAILADRSDIQEELTRLDVHRREVERLTDEGGEVGKRLDFLMQEMNREANTVLSKSSAIGEPGLPITKCGINLKANIERIREQALNLE